MVFAFRRPARAAAASGRRDGRGHVVVAARWDDEEVHLYRLEGPDLVLVGEEELDLPLRRLAQDERIELRGDRVALVSERGVRTAALPLEGSVPGPAIPILVFLVPPALALDGALGAVQLAVFVLAAPLLVVAELAR